MRLFRAREELNCLAPARCGQRSFQSLGGAERPQLRAAGSTLAAGGTRRQCSLIICGLAVPGDRAVSGGSVSEEIENNKAEYYISKAVDSPV